MAISYLVLLISALLLVEFAESDTCPNRYYCHTSEIKYRSFTSMSNSHFNSTHVIRSLPIKEEKICLAQCNSSPKCQSINHYHKGDPNQMICDLIDANIYSNKTQITPMENSTHYFIKSPCASNPCKHAGTCIPLYQEGSYKCACTANNNTVWKIGSHCEKLTVAEMTAKVYYNFNSPHPLKDIKSATGHTIRLLKTDTKAVNVPDRLSPVLFMAPARSAALVSEEPEYLSTCLVDPRKCTEGLSVSFWFKLLKRTQDNFVDDKCSKKYAYPVMSTHQNSYNAFYVKLTGCKTDAYIARVRLRNGHYIVRWGSTHDKQLYQKWSHFAFSYKKSTGIFMYFNGIQVAKETTFTSLGTATSATGFLRLNGLNVSFETYMDDVAMWDAPLTDSDVKRVYEEGKKRNQPK